MWFILLTVFGIFYHHTQNFPSKVAASPQPHASLPKTPTYKFLLPDQSQNQPAKHHLIHPQTHNTTRNPTSPTPEGHRTKPVKPHPPPHTLQDNRRVQHSESYQISDLICVNNQLYNSSHQRPNRIVLWRYWGKLGPTSWNGSFFRCWREKLSLMMWICFWSTMRVLVICHTILGGAVVNSVQLMARWTKGCLGG